MKFLLSLVLIWIGGVLFISFFETPLKFTPEVITTELGVSIGRVIFYYFNKIEIVFALLTIILSYYHRSFKILAFPATLTVILMTQTVLILPILDENAIELLENGQHAPKFWHYTYIVVEIFKLTALLGFAILLFSKFELKNKD